MKLRRFQRRRFRTAGQRAEDDFRIECHESRVIANESADERPSGQALEVVALQRAHLPWRQLELLRCRFDRHAGCFAGSAQQRAGARAGLASTRVARVRHSQVPVAMDFASRESG